MFSSVQQHVEFAFRKGPLRIMGCGMGDVSANPHDTEGQLYYPAQGGGHGKGMPWAITSHWEAL